jgi:hypothetical protein
MTYEITEAEQFWRNMPSPPGSERLFKTAADLHAAACRAFEHFDIHPHRKEVVFHNKGTVVRSYERVMRPYSFRGLALRMGISMGTLNNYRTYPDCSDVMAWIDDVIYNQKFEAAAANMLNAAFIARDLGMAEKTELTGRDGGPLQTQDLTTQEALLDEARRLGISVESFGLTGPASESA